jgi:hypothetical protein
MNAHFPKCSSVSESCRFVSEGGSITLMYSPIQYNHNGEPVGGGGNVKTCGIRCIICKKRWMSKQTELKDAQGVAREWKLVE